MKVRVLFVIALLMFFSPTQAEEWKDADTARQIVIGLLQLADRNQTIQMQHEGYFERNPILGRHPSDGQINTYFALDIGGSYLFNRYICSDYWRSTCQYVMIGFGARTIYLNDRVQARDKVTIGVSIPLK